MVDLFKAEKWGVAYSVTGMALGQLIPPFLEALGEY